MFMVRSLSHGHIPVWNKCNQVFTLYHTFHVLMPVKKDLENILRKGENFYNKQFLTMFSSLPPPPPPKKKKKKFFPITKDQKLFRVNKMFCVQAWICNLVRN